MKILHTADLHLDTCFAGAGMSPAFGNRRRQSLRDVFHMIVQRAGAWPADALLIAGDLFEGDRVSADTVSFLKSEFESIPHVPVFIAPGNHDPYTPTSPYALESWPEHVTIFTSPHWTSRRLDEASLVVHGFAFDGPDVSVNPWGTLRIDDDEGLTHVAVAHGSALGHQPPNSKDYAPFDPADAAVAGLCYLALGHFHAVTHVRGEFSTVMYYSGCPEGHDFQQTGLRHFLEVEIRDGEVRVRPVPSSRIVYKTWDVPCDRFTSSHELVEMLRRFAEEEALSLVARVTLKGLCIPSVRSELNAVYDAVAPLFEHLELADRTEPLDDYDELAREDTSLGAFVRLIGEELADTPDQVRREMLERARAVGVAAFRNRDLEIRGMQRV